MLGTIVHPTQIPVVQTTGFPDFRRFDLYFIASAIVNTEHTYIQDILGHYRHAVMGKQLTCCNLAFICS